MAVDGDRPDRADEESPVRAALASWLEGPRRGGPEPVSRYRGERLGLPEHGAGSMAGPGRRILAFLIDSVLCALVARGLLHDPVWVTPVFALEVFVLTFTLGGSAGHLLLGLRVGRLGGPLTAVAALVRTVLLCLLIPALIWDRDGRGLHDRLARTVLVRR